MPRLTASSADKLIRDAAPGRYGDGEGLSLSIDKAGRAYWILRCNVRKKSFERSLGPASTVRLAEARVLARQARKDIERGEPSRNSTPTFAQLAIKHHANTAGEFRNRKHAAQWLTSLETYAFPEIGHLPVDEITLADVRKVIIPIWRDKRETARRVRQRIRKVLAVAKADGWRNDFLDWETFNTTLPPSKRIVRHMPALDWEDVPAFYQRIATSSASSPIVRSALSFLILTNVRPGNVRFARYENITGSVWAIPAEQMKADREHRAPLPTQAVAIIQAMAAINARDSKLIFPSDDTVTPLSEDTLRMAMRRMGEDDATPHGFRSSFKDWSRAKGYPDWLSEIQLAHADNDQTRAAYARGDHLDARMVMVQAWADYVTGKVSA